VTARQDQLEVHEVALDSDELLEEEFIGRGSGSHFESRVSEVVVLIPSAEGFAHLPQKVDQLVARGFHNLVVSCELAAPASLEPLQKAKDLLDTWAGSLRVCQASQDANVNVEGVELHGTREDAIEAYRAAAAASEEGAPLDAGESSDLLESSGSSDDLNDWGWGSGDDTVEATGPRVEVAELLVDDHELPRLEHNLRKVVQKGKKHVSLRLHFERPMREEDVTILTACRDFLTREGGQLALVALPDAALKWLRLLDFEREFLVVETADEAEAAHIAHSSGEDPRATLPKPPPALPEVLTQHDPYVLVSQDGDAYTVRPRATLDDLSVRRTNQELPLLTPEDSDLSGLADRVRGVSVGAIVDLGSLRDASQSKALQPLVEASSVARDHQLLLVCANVSHEVRVLLPSLGAVVPCGRDLAASVVAFAEALHAREQFEELRVVLQVETLAPRSGAIPEPVSGLEFESGITMGDVLPDADPESADGPPANQAELDELRVRHAKAQGEAERLADELRVSQARLDQTERDRDQSRGTISELQDSLRRNERRVNELEQAQVLAERRAREAESSSENAEADTRRLDGELLKLRQEVDTLRQELSLAKEAAQAGGDAMGEVAGLQGQLTAERSALSERTTERDQLQGQLNERDKTAKAELDQLRKEFRAERDQLMAGAKAELKALRKEAKAEVGRLDNQMAVMTSAQEKGDLAQLTRQVSELEESKARILTEAETEIERLTREQNLLREELESAGEMIERLGKELELS
jgi:hypothetical protein